MEIEEVKEKPFVGFAAGYKQLNDDDKSVVQVAIWDILGIKNRISFGQYKNGWQDVKDPAKRKEIENLFARHGVTENIWGQ